jgi:hypothetical protein
VPTLCVGTLLPMRVRAVRASVSDQKPSH